MSTRKRAWTIHNKDATEDYEVERDNMLAAWRKLCTEGIGTAAQIDEVTRQMRAALYRDPPDGR